MWSAWVVSEPVELPVARRASGKSTDTYCWITCPNCPQNATNPFRTTAASLRKNKSNVCRAHIAKMGCGTTSITGDDAAVVGDTLAILPPSQRSKANTVVHERYETMLKRKDDDLDAVHTTKVQLVGANSELQDRVKALESEQIATNDCIADLKEQMRLMKLQQDDFVSWKHQLTSALGLPCTPQPPSLAVYVKAITDTHEANRGLNGQLNTLAKNLDRVTRERDVFRLQSDRLSATLEHEREEWRLQSKRMSTHKLVTKTKALLHPDRSLKYKGMAVSEIMNSLSMQYDSFAD